MVCLLVIILYSATYLVAMTSGLMVVGTFNLSHFFTRIYLIDTCLNIILQVMSPAHRK
jgi:hypothetical protein